MSAPSAKAKPSFPPLAAYVAPQPCLVACRRCGATVLAQVYHYATKEQPGRYESCGEGHEPLTGEAHQCRGSPRDTA